MSFKKAKIAFDGTNIINIKGYNDSGKSAVLRALVVCFMDMWKASQKKFIRHGEEYFRIVVTFDDGVSILRDKYANGQSLYEVYRDGKLEFTTKQGNKLSKIDGVPEIIQDYLGLCVTDSVYLNYQSCVDRLPVVDTKGSENYQMFHEVLRMEEIYRANNMVNTDKNELGGRITVLEEEVRKNEILLERCGDVSEEFIDELSKLEEEAEETNKRKSLLDETKDIMNRYESIEVLPEIKKVSDSRLKEVVQIKNTLDSLNSIETLPRIEKVSADRLKEVVKIKGALESLEKMESIPKVDKVSIDRLRYLRGIENDIKNIQSFVSIPEVPKVDNQLLERMSALQGIYKSLKGYVNIVKACSTVDKKLAQNRRELNREVSYLEERGMQFVKCKNCGTYSVVKG